MIHSVVFYFRCLVFNISFALLREAFLFVSFFVFPCDDGLWVCRTAGLRFSHGGSLLLYPVVSYLARSLYFYRIRYVPRPVCAYVRGACTPFFADFVLPTPTSLPLTRTQSPNSLPPVIVRPTALPSLRSGATESASDTRRSRGCSETKRRPRPRRHLRRPKHPAPYRPPRKQPSARRRQQTRRSRVRRWRRQR